MVYYIIVGVSCFAAGVFTGVNLCVWFVGGVLAGKFKFPGGK